jgi:hypothetical protein
VKRSLPILIAVLTLITLAQPARAGRNGRADLTLRQRTTNTSTPAVKVGDELEVEAFVIGNGESVTQVTFFLSFDDTYLELIPVGTRVQNGITITTAWTKGEWLGGTPFYNDTLGDAIGNSAANQIPRFQIRYTELIQKFQGAPQRVAIGNGVAARFRVRVIRKPPSGTTQISIDRSSPSGGETGYFINGEPGITYNYRNMKEMTVSVEGLKLTSLIPDVYILPGQVDTTLDLDAYLDDEANPDATITWSASTADPDSINVSINSTTHVVSLDPRISSTGASTDFVGFTGVKFTAATPSSETVDDSIRVVVDSPPAFDEIAIADTVRFVEDAVDTSLVLVAVDPDPGAVLTFSSLDTGFAVNTPATVSSTGRVTFTPRASFSGAENRRFRVEDQYGLADTVAIYVEVSPENDPPEFYRAFPTIEIGALGQHVLDLPTYLRDVDDPYERLELTFTGVDSIAFEVTPLNTQLKITAVTPFVGTRTATIVAKDTSDATGVSTINVTVIPPDNPQPPEAVVGYLKVGVKAGLDTSLALDDFVTDVDTPKNRLIWKTGTVELVSIDQVALSQRQLVVSADQDSIGWTSTTLTVTDPTLLFDVLPVRIYSASPTTGVPVAGGLPDLTIPVGEADSLDLDGYYFDATNTDDEMLWSFTGNVDIAVELDRLTRRTILRAPAITEGLSEEIVFTATDPDGNAVSDTMRVTVLPEGAVLVDLTLLVEGGVLTIPLGSLDTLDLASSLRAGDPEAVVWTAVSRDAVASVSLDEASANLEVAGARVGNTFVVITATSPQSSSTDSIRVAVASTSAGLQVVETFELNLQAERDTIVNLNTLVISGNSPNLLWSSPGNPNVGVEVDQSTQLATLRPKVGFTGEAGAIQFQVTNPVTAETALSTATPVTVVGGGIPTTRGLLRVSVVANPILPNFLDVFVISQRDLIGDPFLRVQAGEGEGVNPRSIQVDSVEQVTNVWVGDLALSDAVVGRVELSSTGITQTTRVALTDTLVLEIKEAGIQSTFSISSGGAAVSLPRGALSKSAIVALIPRQSRPKAASRKLVESGQSLTPVSGTYLVHATQPDLTRAGTIAFGNDVPREIMRQAGVYRWDAGVARWQYAGAQTGSAGISGEFSAFGIYGLFADQAAPRVSGPVYSTERATLSFPVEEEESGVDAGSITVSIGGNAVEAAYSREEGNILVRDIPGTLDGPVDLSVSVADMAGNLTDWERRMDLSHLIPIPTSVALCQNYPNPFNPSTVVRFELPTDGAVLLVIYNALGQEIRHLVDARVSAGIHSVSWDARDDGGRHVAAGAYLYALRTNAGLLVRKMLLLK